MRLDRSWPTLTTYLTLMLGAAGASCQAQQSTDVQPPTQLVATSHDQRVDLRWDGHPDPDHARYHVYRSTDAAGPFVKLTETPHRVHVYSDFHAENGRTFYYRATRLHNGTESEPSTTVSATSSPMSDDDLLTSVQEAAFRYFWDFAHPVSGLGREGFTHPRATCTTGGTGFGMMSIMVGAHRGFVSRDEAARHLLKMVTFLEEHAERYHGAWAHWLDGTTGKTIAFAGPTDNGGDIVETSFLIQGMLTVRQYFDADNDTERELRERITRLWHDVEWDWYLREEGNLRLYWHWSPDHGWAMNHTFHGFNECHITYILAMASPTHPIPFEAYEAGWIGDPAQYADGGTYYGFTKPVGPKIGGPLFFTHYSYLGLDPAQVTDRFCNYFENNRLTTLINRAYCIDNPGDHAGYSPMHWGLTSSQNPDGYGAHAPQAGRDNGTIAPTAAICSMPYTPTESMAALKHMYYTLGPRIWGPFGFYDAFNFDKDWVSPSFLAIDQGPMAPMIENHRSGLCWKMFMSNAEIQPVLDWIRDDAQR